VKGNGWVIGRLKVSKGSIVWVPKDKSYGYKLSWKQFDELLQEHGRHEGE
jgi:hypothetical protein